MKKMTEEPDWVEPLIKSLNDKGWRMFDNNAKMISFEIGDVERGRVWREYYKDTGDFIMYNPDQKISTLYKWMPLHGLTNEK